jgi:hypothetical protein
MRGSFADVKSNIFKGPANTAFFKDKKEGEIEILAGEKPETPEKCLTEEPEEINANERSGFYMSPPRESKSPLQKFSPNSGERRTYVNREIEVAEKLVRSA